MWSIADFGICDVQLDGFNMRDFAKFCKPIAEEITPILCWALSTVRDAGGDRNSVWGSLKKCKAIPVAGREGP
jgi:hypothetical protein